MPKNFSKFSVRQTNEHTKLFHDNQYKNSGLYELPWDGGKRNVGNDESLQK